MSLPSYLPEAVMKVLTSSPFRKGINCLHYYVILDTQNFKGYQLFVEGHSSGWSLNDARDTSETACLKFGLLRSSLCMSHNLLHPLGGKLLHLQCKYKPWFYTTEKEVYANVQPDLFLKQYSLVYKLVVLGFFVTSPAHIHSRRP